MKPYHSRGKDDWGTPQELYDYYRSRYAFGLDIAASQENTKCDRFLTEEIDALKSDWYYCANGETAIWGNPPYSQNAEFMEWAWDLTNFHAGNEVPVGTDTIHLGLLVPARTDTKWWHEYVMDKAKQVEFIKGRVCFEGAPAGAPFPSAFVIYNPQHTALGLPTQYVSLSLSPLVRGFKPKGTYEKEDGSEGRSEEREEACEESDREEDHQKEVTNWG